MQRSFLKSLIPFRYAGGGIPTDIIRSVFLRHEMLIPRLLGTLEVAPLPAMPRMMFAEAFQMLLSGRYPQREVRSMFEDSSVEMRRWLNEDGLEAVNPVLRLLGYELLAAASFYFALMSITSTPNAAASIAVRSVVTSDLKSDKTLLGSIVAFEELERDIATGARVEDPGLDVVVQEMLLLERDSFGKHRFDFRGSKRHILHHLEVESVGRTERSLALVKDPVMKGYGNFSTSEKVVHQGRWIEHQLWCNDEDSRVDSTLPLTERVKLSGDGWDANVLIDFGGPLCDRMLTTHSSIKAVETMSDVRHVEVFELAVPDRDSTFLERWFRR
jgi:hypothetical protein